MLEKTIEIGIAIEIENFCNTNMFNPDFDSDFDPEKDISEAIKAKVNDIVSLTGENGDMIYVFSRCRHR